ncbi:META domain-containing protein [Rubrivivax albus]|uniref:META domain-containing protein n=1 Tax=Rubrivivax albus TaxID=2499835 RepID=A0A437JUL2_9BURK|nr:META domain-containing protein [Rubrivivax albus]RVT50929.1 META domain-containing protein [Rubrivivax albus]
MHRATLNRPAVLAGTAVVSAMAAAVMAGCAAAMGPGTAAPATLEGTQWQLVALQSMDDAQGTTRPADPGAYTLHFGPEGRAALRVDCNRAMGTWQVTPAADGRSGALQFGPLAGTRAMCPPESLAPRLMRDLPFVRSYLLRDGQLHLSLMADGGILSWAPAPR